MSEKTLSKSFSDELVENREFEIGGEIFKWRYPHWEEMATIYDEDVAKLRSTNGDASPTTKESIDLTIKRILVFLDGGTETHKRFKTLAARKTDPIPLHQFGALYRWLLETTSGRPTKQPSDSEPGAGNTEATSPAESS